MDTIATIQPQPNVTIKKVNGQKVFEASISRSAENGIEIKLKSSVNWDFLKSDKTTMIIGKIRCYRPKTGRLDNVPGAFVTEDTYYYEEYPNLSLILATEIKNGVTFNFGFQPISQEKINDWMAKFKEQVKSLYLTYLTPINVSMVINSNIVERESHDV